MGEDGGCIGETWSKFYKEFLAQTFYILHCIGIRKMNIIAIE